MDSNRSIWKDSVIVIMISFVVAALSLPFKDILPILLKVIVNNYASIVGYLFLCYLRKKVEVWHLSKVSLAVWAILTPVYIIINWNLIGTKYTVTGIVLDELQSEIISVIIGGLTYFIVTKIKNTITIKNVLVKPKGLKETTVLMGILNIAGLIFFDSSSKHLGFEVFLFTVVIAISYLVLWYYWQGNNWARILVMLSSILCLFNLFTLKKYSFEKATILVAEAALGLFLLWWLNTESAKSYFGKSKRNA